MEIHPDDWETWQELIKTLKKNQVPTLNTKKRKRAILAIAEYVDFCRQEAKGGK